MGELLMHVTRNSANGDVWKPVKQAPPSKLVEVASLGCFKAILDKAL